MKGEMGMGDGMMTTEEIERAKVQIENLKMLKVYWQGMQRDAEMRVLVFAHEVARVQDELSITEMMLQMNGLTEKIEEVKEAVQAAVASAAAPEPPKAVGETTE